MASNTIHFIFILVQKKFDKAGSWYKMIYYSELCVSFDKRRQSLKLFGLRICTVMLLKELMCRSFNKLKDELFPNAGKMQPCARISELEKYNILRSTNGI